MKNAPIKITKADAIAAAWAGAASNAEATQRLRDMMAADPALYREIVAPFEEQAAAMAVQRKKIADRAYAWSRPTGPDARVGALARVNAASILDQFRLDTGLPLGDATKADLIDCAARYDDRARWNADKASFLMAVAQRIAGKKTVRECMTADEVEQIRVSA